MAKNERRIAGAGTLLGKLQRGRGAGFLEAMAAPREDVWAMLRECIENDPRWDTQCHSRDEYYAGLILKTGMDIRWLGEAIRERESRKDSESTWLVIYILEKLTRAGDERAVGVLRDYVSWGSHWECAVRSLYEGGKGQYLDGIGEAICRRFSDDAEIETELYCLDEGVLDAIGAQSERLAAMCSTVKAENERNRKDRDKPEYERIGLGELFNLADEKNNRRIARAAEKVVTVDDLPFLANMVEHGDMVRKAIALGLLGKLGTEEGFAIIEKFVDDNPDPERVIRRHIFWNIANAPSWACLKSGRRWFQSGHHFQQVAGRDILEEHAEYEDVPMVVETIVRTMREGEQCVCGMLGILAAIEDYGRIDELGWVFEETQDSLGRLHVAEAMIPNDADWFISEYARECLWDCEGLTRKLALEWVDIDEPGVRERLKEMADDLMEDDDIHEAARKRI
jgi:hypothetical protein